MTTTAAQAKERRERAKDNGECYSCGKRPSVKPRKQCLVCRERQRIISARYYENNREHCLKAVGIRREKMKASGELRAYNRKFRLRAQYGMTPECYNRMAEAQDWKCCICQEEPSGGRYQILFVDHDHETDLVRGLLCDRCNRGLGFFGDSAERLYAAAEYVMRHRKGEPS